MFKKTITWTDLNDQEQTSELYFHLSKLELGEFQAVLPDWLNRIQSSVKNQNLSTGMGVYKDLVRFSIGVKSEDGSRFVKTPEIQNDLMSSPAVEELIYGFMINPQTMVEFVTALLPKEMRDAFRKNMSSNPELAEFTTTPVVEDNRPAWEKENRNPTPQEFAAMTADQKKDAFFKVLGGK